MTEGLLHMPMTEASAAGVSEGVLLPGAALRTARENQGLTVDAVALATRFGVRQVEALERDDYASLPGMTTVRGFVRSYAKYLQLDVVPLLAALDSVVPLSVPEVLPPANMGEAGTEVGARRSVVTYLLAICVVVVLALTVYGYMMQREQPSMPRASNTLENSQSIPVAPINSPANSAGAVSAGLTSGSAILVPPVPPVSPASPAPSGLPVIKDVAPEMGGNPVAATAPVPLPVPVLSVMFDGLSWIEVRDATQKVVLSGEFPVGTTQKIMGTPPFQLWVGKASAVRVFSGERRIDLQPFTRADVARLTIE